VGYGGLRGERGYRASIYFFRNIGTVSQARFELVTTDYLGLSDKLFVKEKTLITATKPFFADLNGDGTTDFGFWNNSFKGMEIRYLPNTAPRGRSMVLDTARIIRLPNPINFVNGENLLYYDLDQDGKLDVLVAKNSGNVEHHRNIGSTPNPMYELVSEKFGGIDADFEKRAQGMTLADLNGDRLPELILGDLMGTLRVYQDFSKPNTNLKPDSNLIFNEFLNMTAFQKIGMGLYPAAGDLDGDGLPELLVGLNLGGIRFFKNTSPKVAPPTTDNKEFIVFPNPTTGLLYIQNPEVGWLELYNLTGQILQKQEIKNSLQETTMDLSQLPSGLYFIRFISTTTQTTRKVIVAH